MTWHTCIVEVKDSVKCPFSYEDYMCSLDETRCTDLDDRCPLSKKAFVIFKVDK